MRALKGRTGRRGTAKQAVPVAENDFPVRAEIDEERRNPAPVYPGSQDTRNGITAHKPGLHRRKVNPGTLTGL